MTLIKTAENCGPVPQAFLDAVSRASTEAGERGVLKETGVLASTARSTRARLTNGHVSITDGPFTEVKEVLGGYAVVEAESQEEAVDGAVRLLELYKEHWPGWEGEIEVRQLLGPEDFDPGAPKP